MKADQQGMSQSVQVALLLPLAMLTLLGTLQWSLLLWAESVAAAAAADAARAAALWGGTEQNALTVGFDAAAGSALSQVNITVDRQDQWSVATVTGKAVQILPLVSVDVLEIARFPTQRPA